MQMHRRVMNPVFMHISGSRAVLDIQVFSVVSGDTAERDGWGVLYYQDKDGNVLEHVLSVEELRGWDNGVPIVTNPDTDDFADFDGQVDTLRMSDEDKLMMPIELICDRIGQIRSFFAGR